MATTIDRAGRVVIPKEIRELAGLTAGTPLEIRYVGGHVEIAPEPITFHIIRRKGKPILQPDAETERISAADMQALIDAGRDRRP
jgi:AbrB family looped-hinge helix DNA binding protein